MVYQPIVRVRSGEVWAYESLMRPVASREEMVAAGLVGIREADAWAQEWSVRCTVNVDGAQAGDEETVALLQSCAGVYGIELTEHDVLDAVVEKLALSVRGGGGGGGVECVMLDDFGTNWSTLESLTRVRVDVLKVDRSVAQSLGGGRDGVVRGIVEMAHSMGLLVIAEGVEDVVAARRLVSDGVDGLQGWWVGRERGEPLTGEEVESLRLRVLDL